MGIMGKLNSVFHLNTSVCSGGNKGYFKEENYILTLCLSHGKHVKCFLNNSVNINIHAFLLTCSGARMEDKHELKIFKHI